LRRDEVLSSILRASILLLLIAGFLKGDYRWVISALIGALIVFIPSVIEKDLRISLPDSLNLMIFLALFLHIFGTFTGFYDVFWWWDKVTHFFSAFVVASLGLAAVMIIDLHLESVYLTPKVRILFILMFVMAMGVLWEIMEYSADQILHTKMQVSLYDTLWDLLCDFIGAIAASFLGSRYIENLLITFGLPEGEENF